MKRIAFAAIAACVASVSFAESTPVMVSLVTPVQAPSGDRDVAGFRLSLIYGQAQDFAGLDIGIANHSRKDFTGLGIGGVNIAGERFCGGQRPHRHNRKVQDHGDVAQILEKGRPRRRAKSLRKPKNAKIARQRPRKTFAGPFFTGKPLLWIFRGFFRRQSALKIFWGVLSPPALASCSRANSM